MNFSTTDMKQASALCALGIPLRNPDPVTHVVHADTGDRQFIFWFDCDEEQRKLANNWQHWFKAGEEHPMYYIRAALENRDRLMSLMHKATPLRLIKKNGITVLYAENAPQHIKEKLKSLL